MKLTIRILTVLFVALLVVRAYQGMTAGPDPDPGKIIPSRKLVLVYESSNSTTAAQQSVLDLRDGPQAAYFSGGGIILNVVDQDAQDEHGKKAVDPADYAGKQPPVLIFRSIAGNKVTRVEQLAPKFTADQVVALAKRYAR